jgi:hypothetical protein
MTRPFFGKSRERLPRATVCILAFSLALPTVARAQGATTAEESPARKLFLEGRALTSQGNYAEACPKFEASLRLELGVGTQFNLADCWEHIGRTASAQALFLGAAASAKAAGQADREQVLRDRALALEPRLSRLVIDVAATAAKLTVKRGELPLDSDSWGKAVAVDPGLYTVRARAPGKKPWEKVIEVTAEKPVTTVEVPELESSEAEAVPEPVVPSKPTATKPPPAAPSEAIDREPSYLNYRALSVAGIGLSAVVVGSVMGLRYRSANNDAKDICPSSHDCSVKQIQEHDRLIDKARTDRAWSYAGFGVGTAALAGAAVLWLVQRPKSRSTANWQAAPLVAPGGTFGAGVSGAF